MQVTENHITELVQLMHCYSYKWDKIGLQLGFIPSELATIRHMPSLVMSAPESYLVELLHHWVQWPIEGHPRKPTIRALCESLRSFPVGLGSLALQVEAKFATGKYNYTMHGRMSLLDSGNNLLL